MRQSRRQFIRNTGLGVAGLAWLKESSARGNSQPDATLIPPHEATIVPGIFGYAEQSVPAGSRIAFRISNTVPCRISIYRLGRDADSPAQDELLHTFSECAPTPQPIHPGSYVHVQRAVTTPLKALTLETWIRPRKLKQWAGIITQYDSHAAREFGLFLGPGGAVSFCVGASMRHDDIQVQLSAKSGIPRSRWHHVVATWDGRKRRLFVNGKLRGEWPCHARPTPGAVPLRLAAFGREGLATGFLDGDLSMPVIYTRVLEAAEIQERFEARGRTMARGPGVAACWPFGEEKGHRVADVSPARRHGRIINHGTWRITSPAFDSLEVLRFADYDPAKDGSRGHALRFASDDLYDCRWRVTHEWRVPPDARSGLYVARVKFDLEGKPHLHHITFAVKRSGRRPRAPLLVLAATNTWRAYSSTPFARPDAQLLRNASTQGTANSPGDPPAFSFYRRHAGGQGCYQIGLRMPFFGADPYLLYGAAYSHLARADRFTHIWLEQSGYDYDLITDLDLHRDPEILRGYRALVIAGHSEYWSIPAYQAVDRYLQAGGNLVVLSGNSLLWRVSFDKEGSVIECRKVDAPGEQMLPHERGEAWHSHDGGRGGLLRECGFPAWRIIGLDMLGWVSEAGFGPYVVERPEHFLFHHPEPTGLERGDRFGQAQDGRLPRANGHEVDIRMSTFAALQQEPTPAGAVHPVDPPGMLRIANGITDWTKGSAFDYFFRRIQPPEPQGAEMIFWERENGGKVFNAGAIAAGWALQADPKFQTLLRNVLFHFGVEPRPATARR